MKGGSCSPGSTDKGIVNITGLDIIFGTALILW